MKHSRLLSASILIVSVLPLSAGSVSSRNKEHQNQTSTHNSGAEQQADPTPSLLTMVQPTPAQVIQTSSTIEKNNPHRNGISAPRLPTGEFWASLSEV